jgi:hypothetical protein
VSAQVEAAALQGRYALDHMDRPSSRSMGMMSPPSSAMEMALCQFLRQVRNVQNCLLIEQVAPYNNRQGMAKIFQLRRAV